MDRDPNVGRWRRMAMDFRSQLPAFYILLAIIGLRVLSFGWLAIFDPTESRTAEIAKRMYESGDWLTPRLYIHGELIPYWGKPPLHFWLTSLSYQVFGVSEWSSRLPSILAGLLMIAATLLFARYLWGIRVAMISAIILSSSGLFFVLWGACVIDISLSATMTLTMIAFAMMILQTNVRARWLWGIVFFLSLALGMLTKGPVAPAVVILSIGIWLLIYPQWRSLKQIPWISGTIVFLAVSLPWYALQEKATPGFLRYFFMNENVLRFLTHDYGDKYGSGHVYPRGTIWAMLAGTYLPWTILLCAVLRLRHKKRSLFRPSKTEAWFNYVLIWGLTPALFFTLSRQLLATYLLPGFAGLAVASAVGIVEWIDAGKVDLMIRTSRWQIVVLSGFVWVTVALGVYFEVPPYITAGTGALAISLLALSNVLKHKPEWVIISLTGLSMTIAIVSGTFNFGGTLDQQRSVKPLFVDLARTGRCKDVQLCFPFLEPASADFYEKLCGPKSILHSGQTPETILTKALDNYSNELFLFRTIQWQKLAPEFKKRLALEETRGNWTACRKKADSPQNPP